ncbi:hypothetical protein [Vibrio sp. H11]|uniref:hypothetical protein n=1 Tax=Vibrio sp. H11 TaxID=2565928 RepID=UPI001980A810|nr:hypothetical protein [Vibrio sp. H11]
MKLADKGGEAMAELGMLQVIQVQPDFDAVVIACFDDTGLDAARCITVKLGFTFCLLTSSRSVIHFLS